MTLKSFLIKGSLSNGFLNFSLIDTDFSKGKWLLCLKQVVFEAINSDIFETENVSISCNLISDYRNVNNQKEFYFPALALATLKNEKNVQSKSFDQLWFEVNNPHKTIEIFFKNLFTDVPLVLDSNVAVLLLLKKIC